VIKCVVVAVLFFVVIACATTEPWSLQGCVTAFPPIPVIKEMHAEIRQKFAQVFRSQIPGGNQGIIFLYGGELQNRYDTDTEMAFRQESNFVYLTGVEDPDFAFAYDIEEETSILFAPKRDEHYALWNGEVMTLEQIQEKFGNDIVIYTEEIVPKLREITNNGAKKIYLLPQQTLPEFPNVDNEILVYVLGASRVIKTNSELTLIRIASKVSSDAHVMLMKDSDPGLFEYNYGAYFEYYSGSCSLIHQAYEPIVGSGNRSAILHYTTKRAQTMDSEILLVDAGAEFRGYDTDITRTYPVNGKFSPAQTLIYMMVEEVQRMILSLVKPGASMREFQTLATHTVTRKLLEAGFLQGPLDTLIANRMWYYFYPHGLGHSVGLDVHDPGLNDILQKNMVITIEPGIYFNRAFVEQGLKDPVAGRYIVVSKVMEFINANFGGVRIEDTIVVTDDGHENLTLVPKSISEIEEIMRGNNGKVVV